MAHGLLLLSLTLPGSQFTKVSNNNDWLPLFGFIDRQQSCCIRPGIRNDCDWRNGCSLQVERGKNYALLLAVWKRDSLRFVANNTLPFINSLGVPKSKGNIICSCKLYVYYGFSFFNQQMMNMHFNQLTCYALLALFLSLNFDLFSSLSLSLDLSHSLFLSFFLSLSLSVSPPRSLSLSLSRSMLLSLPASNPAFSSRNS